MNRLYRNITIGAAQSQIETLGLVIYQPGTKHGIKISKIQVCVAEKLNIRIRSNLV